MKAQQSPSLPFFGMLTNLQVPPHCIELFYSHIEQYSCPTDSQVNVSLISTLYDGSFSPQLIPMLVSQLTKLQSIQLTPKQAKYLFVLLLWDSLFSDFTVGPLLSEYIRVLPRVLPYERLFVEWCGDISSPAMALRVRKCNDRLQSEFERLRDEGLSEEGKLQIFSVIEGMCLVIRLLYESNKAKERIRSEAFVNKRIEEYFDPVDQFLRNFVDHRDGNMLKYPFLLSFEYKYRLMQIQSIYEQDISIKKTLHEGLAAVARGMNLAHGLNGLINLCFTINRNNLLDDSMEQISRIKTNLKSPLKIEFVGEQGADQGGLSNEYFQLVIKALFNPYLDMFIPKNQNRFYWLNASSFQPPLRFQFAGMILGLSIYNSVHLDVHFPDIIYKKLLKETEPTLQDLKEIEPEIYNGLLKILESKEPLQPLQLYFTLNTQAFGVETTHELVEEGREIRLTQDNKEFYCMCCVDFLLNKHIERQFIPFKRGFRKVVSGTIIDMFAPHELRTMICGLQDIDFDQLEKSTQYEGYAKESAVIVMFWNILKSLSVEEKKAFLFFATGTDRVPIEGLGALKFTIQKNSNVVHLPTAHTCFNTFLLPEYESREILEKNIRLILQHNQGFGLI